MMAVMDLSSLGSSGVTIYGADIGDESGISVSSVGDVNGDGFDDVLIGARYGDAASNLKTTAGESYLLFGRSDWTNVFSIDLANLGTAGVTIFGANQYDFSGRTVSSAGDINGDGFDDMFIGAVEGDAANNLKGNAGESYVVFGKANWATTTTIDLANLGTAGVIFYGTDAFDLSGRALSNAGDVNGDGFDDVIIGSHFGDGPSNTRNGSGETAIVFGKASWASTPSVDLANLGPAGVTIFGAENFDNSGLDVAAAGDINGDGFDDVLIGARYGDAANNSRNAAGETYVVFGKSDWSATLTLDLATLGTSGVILYGANTNDYSGLSVSGAGDVNGDGFDDFLIGAVGGDGSTNTNQNRGETYMVFGKASWTATPTIDLATLGAAGVTFYGVDDLDNSGLGVSSGGDINGDGFDDLLVGARYADAALNARSASGDSYVVFGRADWSATQSYFLVNLSTDGITLDGSKTRDYSGGSLSDAGDVNGDGFDDFIIGAIGGDGINETKGEAGESYLIFGNNNFTQSATHLGTGSADTLIGNSSANIMIGERNNDTMIGVGGADVLRGGQGNDILGIGDLNYRRIVGGRGVDTLRLDTSGAVLDLTTRADNRTLDIEQINITGTGANTLTLNVLEVLNLSNETNTLVVFRDGNDTVNRGSGWIQQANEVIGGNTFEVFTQGAATLKIQISFADIAISKTASVTSVLAGGSFFYTAQVTNSGPASATGVLVTDTLPNGLSFDSANSSATCSAVGQSVTCNLGTINSGTNKSAQIGVKVASSVADGTVISNVAGVSENELDPTMGDHTSGVVSVTVSREADIRVTKTASVSNVTAGGTMTYSIQIANLGPSDASGITVSDTLASQLTFVSGISDSQCVPNGQLITCSVGTVAAGTTVTRRIGVNVASSAAHGSTINNTASVTVNETDPTPGDHSGSVAVTVNRQADLAISKSAPQDTVVAGSSMDYTIVVNNAGLSNASNVTVTDVLPAGLTFNAAGSSAACSAAGQTVTCAIGSLVASTSSTQTIRVDVDAGLSRGTKLTNTATVAATETDPVSTNNSSTFQVTVNVNPDPTPWQNVKNPLDVNDDGFVTPIDALQIINELNSRSRSNPDGSLPVPPPPGAPPPYLDVTGDNFAVPGDVLQIINFLNSQGNPEGESGEGEGESAATFNSAADGAFGPVPWDAALARPTHSRLRSAKERHRSSAATDEAIQALSAARDAFNYPHLEDVIDDIL